MKKNPPKSRLMVLACLIAVVVVIIGALVLRLQLIPRSETTIPVVPTTTEPKATRAILLYFGSPDGSRLLSETRQVECAREEECVRANVQALIDGPTGALVPLLPAGVILRGAYLHDDTAELDFSRDLISAHPGGSASELLTVYGLADSLAVNFPRIRRVRILVEGAAVETLKGHVGLLEPVKADFTYTRPADGSPSGGSMSQEAAPYAAGDKRK